MADNAESDAFGGIGGWEALAVGRAADIWVVEPGSAAQNSENSSHDADGWLRDADNAEPNEAVGVVRVPHDPAGRAEELRSVEPGAAAYHAKVEIIHHHPGHHRQILPGNRFDQSPLHHHQTLSDARSG